MTTKNKIIKEIKSVFWTSLYFFCWFGALMIIKLLLLKEYHIEFFGFSTLVVGTLVVAKVVLILEYVKIPFTRNKPAYVEIIVRTLFYLAGVFLIMALEKSFEARHEYSGFLDAFRNLSNQTDIYHLYVNTLCVLGALFFFNTWTVIKKMYGAEVFRKIMNSPVPPEIPNDPSKVT